MEKLTEKLETLKQEIVQRISELIATKGVNSKHNSDIVLSIQDEEQMHNLEGGRYLVELNTETLIDNDGYQYNLNVLELESLCLVIDSIAEQPSKFRVGTMDSNGTMEEFKYFEDEEEMYEHFTNVRAKIVDGEHESSEVWTEKRTEEPNRHGEHEYETMQTYNFEEDEIENA